LIESPMRLELSHRAVPLPDGRGPELSILVSRAGVAMFHLVMVPDLLCLHDAAPQAACSTLKLTPARAGACQEAKTGADFR